MFSAMKGDGGIPVGAPVTHSSCSLLLENGVLLPYSCEVVHTCPYPIVSPFNCVNSRKVKELLGLHPQPVPGRLHIFPGPGR